MFSEKMDFYKECSCKWFTAYINIIWPIILIWSLIMMISSGVNWTESSAAILVSNLIMFVPLFLADVHIRFLDKAAYALWFVGNIAPLLGCISFYILASSGFETQMNNASSLSDILSFGLYTAFTALYGAMVTAMLLNFIVLFIINAVYITKRRRLFYLSELELKRSSYNEDDE